MKVFTTGQVAKICKVDPRTVSKWFDSGRLKGYRIPGSQDRRIPREYLIKFLKEHGMPLGELAECYLRKVVVVSQDAVLLEGLRREMPTSDWKLLISDGAFEAGTQIETSRPHVLVADLAIGRAEALSILMRCRASADFSGITLVALLPDGCTIEHSLVNECFRKPIDPVLFVDRLKTLTDPYLVDA